MSRAVDVVIVTADTRDLVLRCLDRLDDPAIRSRTVVDNCSRDGTAEAVRAAHPDCRVVTPDRPVGYATACNLGAEGGAGAAGAEGGAGAAGAEGGAGGGELILFLNSDILAHADAVAQLAAALDGDPGAVAAGGRLVDPGTLDTQHRYGPKALPTLATFAARLSGVEQLWPGNPWTTGHLTDPPPDTHTTAVVQPAGACLLVRRVMFEAIGGFDEAFWFWYEDVDLARRLAERGSLLYVPAAVFEHVGGASFSRWNRADGVRVEFAGLLVVLSGPRALIYAPFDRELAAAHRAIVAAAFALARERPIPRLVTGC
jgi:N-acetylglucosaminyl-diphospho-decaprenol L-rhamnosyltransferase